MRHHFSFQNLCHIPISQLCLLLVCCGLLLIAHPAGGEVIDRVVAVVNDDVITLSEVDAEAQGVYGKIHETVPAEERLAALAVAREEVLETIIDKKLIAQRAKALKIKVSEEDIDNAMQQVLARNKISKEELLQNLNASGVSESIYRNTLRTQLLQNKLVGAELRSKVVITDEMARKVYDSTRAPASKPASVPDKQKIYTLQQIGCSWLDAEGRELTAEQLQENKAKAKARIDSVYSKAQAGEDFGALAGQYSDLPSAADQGNLGSFAAGELASYMLQAVANLSKGALSQVIETPAGYQFFKLLDVQTAAKQGTAEPGKKQDGQDRFELVKDDIKKELYDQEMKKAYAEWAKKLKEKAYIQKM